MSNKTSEKDKFFITKEEEREYYDEANSAINDIKKRLESTNKEEYEKLVAFIKECLEKGEKPVDILEPMTEKFKKAFPENEDDLARLLFALGIEERKQLKNEKSFLTHKEDVDNRETIREFREKYKDLINCDALCEKLKNHYYISKKIKEKEGEAAMLAESGKFFSELLLECQKVNPSDLEHFMRVILADPEKYFQREEKKEIAEKPE